jgi:hypothetical protein
MGIFGVSFFVTYYLQQTLDYSPVKSGLAFLPMIGTIIGASVGVNALLLQRIGPRPLIVAGMVLSAAAMGLLTRLGIGSTFAGGVLPSLLLLGAGIGLVTPAAANTATARIDRADAGIASSLVSVGQQIGGSIGTSLLNTVAVSATTTYVAAHHGGNAVVARGTVHGYTVAFWWSVGIFGLGAVLSIVLFTGRARGAPAHVDD